MNRDILSTKSYPVYYRERKVTDIHKIYLKTLHRKQRFERLFNKLRKEIVGDEKIAKREFHLILPFELNGIAMVFYIEWRKPGFWFYRYSTFENFIYHTQKQCAQESRDLNIAYTLTTQEQKVRNRNLYLLWQAKGDGLSRRAFKVLNYAVQKEVEKKYLLNGVKPQKLIGNPFYNIKIGSNSYLGVFEFPGIFEMKPVEMKDLTF